MPVVARPAASAPAVMVLSHAFLEIFIFSPHVFFFATAALQRHQLFSTGNIDQVCLAGNQVISKG
jgi:hypothetical protein